MRMDVVNVAVSISVRECVIARMSTSEHRDFHNGRTIQIVAPVACCALLKARLAFLLISRIYRQMYANTGIATDSARVNRSARRARWMAAPCRYLFAGRPMPDLQLP